MDLWKKHERIHLGRNHEEKTLFLAPAGHDALGQECPSYG